MTSGTLLPILHEADWTGRDVAACRALVPERADVPFMPLVAFAYDAHDRRSTVTRAGLEDEGRPLDALAAEAVRNLVALAIPMRPQGDGSVVAVHELASSLLVSPSDLERARALLGATEVLLATPARGLLVALPKPESGDLGLERFARENFARALDTRISPLVFVWDGASLRLHEEPVAPVLSGRLVEVGYDDLEECLALRLEGRSGPAVLRALERLISTGRDEAGRSIATIRLEVAGETERAEIAARFSEDDVEVRIGSVSATENPS